MIDVQALWKKRSEQYIKETRVYLRYMLNDHLLIVLIFLLGGAAFYYSRWLDELPSGFPVPFIIAIILTVILTNGTVRTLLKEPDLVFLLPIEGKLSSYFQMAFLSSLFTQSYMLVIAFLVISPLYVKTTGTFLALFMLFLVALLCKVWNLRMSWNVSFFPDARTRWSDYVIRLLLNFSLFYLLFEEADVIFIIPILVMMAVLFVYFNRAVTKLGLKWDYLIDLESRRMLAFYRLANLFTDVPKLKERVKKRSWLNWVTGFIKYSKQNTFGYLYIRTFLRTSDYLGMYIRLIIIGGIILYIVPLEYGKLFVLILFLYLTGYQLITLWRHHNLKIWIDIYPISKEMKKSSFLKLLFMLLIVESILYSLFLIVEGNLLLALSHIGAGIAFSYVFVNVYVKNKLSKFM